MRMKFNEEILVGNHLITSDSNTFIIGEAGVNHNGDEALAKKLVDCAIAAGVDAVKFQMFETDGLILKNTDLAPYQKKSVKSERSQYDMLKGLELNDDVFQRIKAYCDEKNILFLCTPFEQSSLDKLDAMGVSAFKVAATDLTNIPFLRQIAQKKKPIILSAGMCYLEEVKSALEAIYPINKDVILLHCTANYPLADDEVNLNVIDTFKREFDVIVGFSDHSVGVGASPYAVAKGAKVVEKHFTLSRKMDGPDHKASVEPEELNQLVKEIRRVETFLGSDVKMPTYSEQFTRKSLQKYIVAKQDIAKGMKFQLDNIITKRTGGKGISALYYDAILGRISDRDYNKDDIVLVNEKDG